MPAKQDSMAAFAAPPGYAEARGAAGVLDRRSRGRIVVSGADRRTYLQGLLSNDIAALTPGRGCYATYLTAQGRMITDLWVFELGDVLVLTLPASTKDAVLAKLDQFIFGEDVQLGDVTETFAGLAVIGPDAARLVSTVLGAPAELLEALPDGGCLRASFGDQPAIVLRAPDLGPPGFEVLTDRAQFEPLRGALHGLGAADVSPDAAEALRVEAGVPVFRQDMDEETIPLEAGIEGRAISLTKGCYVGQEVIIRVLHRGHGRVARKLVGLRFEGHDVPAPGTAISAGGREIGRITSAVASPAVQAPIALGYVLRDFTEAGTTVVVGDTAGVVTATPFTP